MTGWRPPSSSVDGLKLRLAEMERQIADLQRIRGGAGGAERLGATEPDATGGGYAATVTVAASDAADSSKAAADFVCDGTDDQAEINEALDICDDLGTVGGRVLLSEGTFSIGGFGIERSAVGPTNTTLQGQGRTATRLAHVGASRTSWLLLIALDGFRVADLTFDGTGITSGGYGVQLYGQQATVARCGFVGVGHESGASLYLDVAYGRVQDCHFSGGYTGGDAVQLSGARGIATGNYFENTPGHAVYCDPGEDYFVVANNMAINVQNDGSATDAFAVGDYSVAVGNVAVGSAAPASISSGTGSQVANNVLL